MRYKHLLIGSGATMVLAAAAMAPVVAGAAAHSNAAQARAALRNVHIGPALRVGHTTVRGAITKAASYNWSGYVDGQPTSGTDTYTKITTSFLEPGLKCTPEDRIAVFWAGLDGWTSSTVEQAGTFAQCFQGVAHYYTWWEMYPTNNIQIVGSTVAVNDHITVTITRTGTSYQLAVTDSTTPANSFSTTQTCSTCVNSSAELIAERPGGNLGEYPLAQFTPSWTVSGTSVSDTTLTGTMTKFPTYSVTMVDGTDTYALAKPGAYSATTNGFTDKWLNSY